jgi:hypothetical protein
MPQRIQSHQKILNASEFSAPLQPKTVILRGARNQPLNKTYNNSNFVFTSRRYETILKHNSVLCCFCGAEAILYLRIGVCKALDRRTAFQLQSNRKLQFT